MSMPHFTSLSEEQRDHYKSSNGVGELVENVGPCPRDIVEYIGDPKGRIRSSYFGGMAAAMICETTSISSRSRLGRYGRWHRTILLFSA